MLIGGDRAHIDELIFWVFGPSTEGTKTGVNSKKYQSTAKNSRRKVRHLCTTDFKKKYKYYTPAFPIIRKSYLFIESLCRAS